MKVSTSAFTFFALALLLPFVAASPFGVAQDDDTHHALLFGRAGIKYVGASCTSSAECYSANCVNATASTPGTCQRQVTGGVCFENGNCASYNCSNKKCSTPSKANGACSSTTDCGSSLYCGAGICRSLIAPNQRCNDTSQCAAGECSINNCRTNDGDPVQCPGINPDSGYPDPNPYCGRYALGHACTYQGDCELGLCKNGKCTANGEGATCRYDFDCTDLGALCTNGKCLTAAKGSLYPREHCGADEQCLAGSCRVGILPKDAEGVNNGGVSPPSRRYVNSDGNFQCGYLQENQTGCRDLFDCEQQLCKNSTCVYGSVGDRCSINYQCKSKVCGTNGTCLDGKKGSNYNRNAPCGADEQCLSGRCNFFLGLFVQRPSLFYPNRTVLEGDSICLQAKLGGGCRKNSDCKQGQCVNGICTKVSSSSTSTSAKPAASA
ncbi:hypothetical protein V8E36_002247 [Tilletia maclaganii]